MATEADTHSLSARTHAATPDAELPVAAPRKRARRWLILGAAIVLVAGGALLLHQRAAPATGAAHRPQNPPVPVGVTAATHRDMPVHLAALGSVTPYNTVTVRPRVDGQLMRVAFREGQFVHRGDLLAEIDPRPFHVQLEQAEGQLAKDQAQLGNAKTQLARYQLLLSQDSIARSNVDEQASAVAQLEGALKVDQATINSARLNLTYTHVTSPIDGRVGLRIVDAGNIVSAASTTGLVVITQIEPIAVVFTLPEDTLRVLLPRLRDKAKLPVDVFDRSGATHLATGVVETVDNQIDQGTGTVRVKAVFDNKDHALFPLQFVNVQLLADTKLNQVVVPSVAIQHGPQGAFVYVVADGKAVARPVVPGLVEGDTTAIDKGLDGTETVVTESTDRLRDGSRIEVRVPGKPGAGAQSGGANGRRRRQS